jgi:hypothetical protein
MEAAVQGHERRSTTAHGSAATALQEDLRDLRPGTTVVAAANDVVCDADLIRPLLSPTNLVLCATDGVAPRRVVSHLARRAGIDAVLACVLEDGGLGEVIRLRPWIDRGCLACQREALRNAGGIDPEPAIDAGYGTGARHRPMTAVGPDLHLVGQFAAQLAVATLLERRGASDQKLPDEHAVLALRPQAGWATPFRSEPRRGIAMAQRVSADRWLSHLRGAMTDEQAPVGQVLLSSAAAAAIRRESVRSRDGNETRGILLGHLDTAGAAHVRVAGDPGPVAVRTAKSIALSWRRLPVRWTPWSRRPRTSVPQYIAPQLP